ncbi:MAG: MFS transporter [Rhodobacterales bacterium]|nr:MFS transporter [Rhodobacterales bacterium]
MRTIDFLRNNAPWLSAGVLLTFLSGFGQTYFISIFSGEIRAAFDLSHGAWGGIYSLGTTVSAIAMVWAGTLTDFFRVRVLGTGVLAMLALACVAMLLVPNAWLLPVVIFALRFSGQGMTSHIAVVAMSRWYVATRGRALSIASLGFSFGEALLPLIFVALMATYDWRLLWGLAALVTVLGIPILLSLLRHERTPLSMSQNDQSTGMNARHWSRREVLHHRLFWFMIPAILGPSAFNTAFFFQQVEFARTKGWEHVELVALFPLYTIMGIVAMLVSGWALDKWGTARLIPYIQLPMCVAFVVFSYAAGPTGAVIGFFFLALTTGANSTLPNAFWAEFYGTKNLGAIKATATAVMVFGSAIGPGITGVFLDFGIGLEMQYIAIAVYFVFSSMMMKIGIAGSKQQLEGTPVVK